MRTNVFTLSTIKHIRQREWGWLLATGIAYLVIGAFAFSMPVASTVGLSMAVGAFLTVSGIVHLVRAIRLTQESGSFMRYLHALGSTAAGLIMLFNANVGMAVITMALAFYFFVGAASSWILCQAIKPQSGWVLGAVSSVASFLLGVYIVLTFPISALWVPGALIGIDLTLAGISTIALSISTRRIGKIEKSQTSQTEKVA